MAEPEVRALLEAYIAAFENADPAAMERVLRKDAALEPVGSATWFAGRETCLRFIVQFLGAPGDWRMIATSANGQPAAAAYLRGRDGTHQAFGIAVLTATRTGIARIVVFGDPGLVTKFGFPPVLRTAGQGVSRARRRRDHAAGFDLRLSRGQPRRATT